MVYLCLYSWQPCHAWCCYLLSVTERRGATIGQKFSRTVRKSRVPFWARLSASPVVSFPSPQSLKTCHDGASDQPVSSTSHILNFYIIQGDSRLNVLTSVAYSRNLCGIRCSCQLHNLFEPTGGFFVPWYCIILHSHLGTFWHQDLNVH